MSEFLLLLLIASGLVCLLVIFIQSKQLKAKDVQLMSLQTNAQHCTQEAIAREMQLQKEIDQLAEYRPILDALTHAQQVRALADGEARNFILRAERHAEAMRATANEELRQTKREAKEIWDRANSYAIETQGKANLIVYNANYEASRIITEANKWAEEIAGKAFAASDNAATLEKTI